MDKHTEATITQLLRTKYSGNHWAFVPQVPNGTGLHKGRTCDGMAMGLWESKGLHLHGFEIKVSRSDWLSEMQNPEKAAAFIRYCHYWWIVAPPGIVKPGEVAGDWGLQEVTRAGNGLRVKKAAMLRVPELIGHEFLAGLFHACNRESSEAEIKLSTQAGFDAGRKAGLEQAKGCANTNADFFEREAKALRKTIAKFEEASGLSIGMYNGGDLGRDVARARTITNAEETIAGLRKQAKRVLQVLTAEENDF